CHESVDKDLLLADPLVRLCLDHLSADQRRALEQDLELAGQLQRGLLPETDLRFGGWSVCYHYRPLGLVSGDYCDLVVRENGSTNLFFALGDVSGKKPGTGTIFPNFQNIEYSSWFRVRV